MTAERRGGWAQRLWPAATDNGDLMETTPYPSHELPLWHGQASAVIRLTGGAGEIRVTACAEGVTPASLILNAR